MDFPRFQRFGVCKRKAPGMCGSGSPAGHSEPNLHRYNKGAVASKTTASDMWIENILDQVMKGRYFAEETESGFEGVIVLQEKLGLVEFDVI